MMYRSFKQIVSRFRVAQETIGRIEQRLQMAFMLNASVTRQAKELQQVRYHFSKRIRR